MRVGIIGGSGFYSLLDGEAETLEVTTKYGAPSGPITLGTIQGIPVAFISRHGPHHTIPPHKVPYRANITALADLGVERILTTCAVGSLTPEYVPGDFVFIDQFINMTQGRLDSFFDEDVVAHVSTAYPYCTTLSQLGKACASRLGIRHHKSGTVVVINGPRFSSRAESVHFRNMGGHIINMTQYPEVALSRENGMCYMALAIVTDYDSGLDDRDDISPVSVQDVLKLFSQNIDKAKGLIHEILGHMEPCRNCACARALDGAVMSH